MVLESKRLHLVVVDPSIWHRHVAVSCTWPSERYPARFVVGKRLRRWPSAEKLHLLITHNPWQFVAETMETPATLFAIWIQRSKGRHFCPATPSSTATPLKGRYGVSAAAITWNSLQSVHSATCEGKEEDPGTADSVLSYQTLKEFKRSGMMQVMPKQYETQIFPEFKVLPSWNFLHGNSETFCDLLSSSNIIQQQRQVLMHPVIFLS